MISQILNNFSEGETVTVTGRVRLVRSFGKLSFLTIRDRDANIQIGLRGKMQLPALWDIIRVTGTTGYTKAGERTVWSESYETLAVCEGDIASKHEGVENRNLLYTRRHFWLLANPEDLAPLVQRSKIVSRIRRFLDDMDYLEIETPVLANAPSGAAARPFVTRQESTDSDKYLRIATEICLKKALVTGVDRVYEIGKIFRNEGVDWKHHPEFTSIELYQSYATLDDMKKLFVDLVNFAGNRQYNLADIPVYEYDDLVAKYGEDFDSQLQELCFVTGQPLSQTPLCKARPDGKAERFEVFANGFEIANAYNEINTFAEQSQRLQGEHDGLLDALRYGMPPTAGMGIGIDRLCMFLLDQKHIANVVFFP